MERLQLNQTYFLHQIRIQSNQEKMIHQFRIVNDSVNLGTGNSGINSQLLLNILDANDSMRPFYLRAVGKYVCSFVELAGCLRLSGPISDTYCTHLCSRNTENIN